MSDIQGSAPMNDDKIVYVSGEYFRVRSVLPNWFWGAVPTSIRDRWVGRKVARGQAEVMTPIAQVTIEGTVRRRRRRN